MEILGKLFGSESRVKILRLFLFNQGAAFCAEEVAERSKANLYVVKHELKLLRKVGFIKRKMWKKPVTKKRRSALADGWTLDERFAYLSPMQKLLLDTVFMSDAEIYRRFSGAGKMKLVIVAGVFIQNLESRLDLLIAGDNLKRHVVEHVVKGLEAEIGKELTYAAFDMQELQYRVGMYDRLLRDVMESPHRTLLDKVGFEKKFIEANSKK
ncbi:MAG: hypothetical protein A3C08_02895 [Candidatus Taylorbacteria bacterium RIFCSPHIGHO2_02_FULL_47_18]|uniref:HTH arsR-type domain-containing protein n=1 Tax=Candidatus Taylorbacteria bacterium RIFCSPLOWO2_01_FULL_48_100 TaxID=1802322 RepID=A0A1G2NGB3_9BACT|nr:MAG: hypothetical protein A2670_02250 [Candidatus Taylorbacteria bacterium RIFCSPHIGHO2_01_FULL_48_38]OHA27684.1 MAG: hypothetical protein A3C08_02895 [Candidatus Taylorbacteria bacterium RIFCSPHIGHO2_02_FULL_47_18]OHA35104.1 MAG: hypothetical protein A2938_01665 [Candidatus Taylorbacteria bacterium RIFCSPLOWO2_01_FULL_48_100]OHA41018.1 MAG: hypothetical protein A3J31_02915 [Candidatus Taylorbacteria bacterium RIFCSPLOWO2_02_FULL_48_16]OHA44813.1 MAG: hypothetical protein A3H13_02230 [Candid